MNSFPQIALSKRKGILFVHLKLKWFLLSVLAKEELKKKSKHPQDNRLSKREFRHFVTLVADSMPGADSFEYFLEFLNNSVEVNKISQLERFLSCVTVYFPKLSYVFNQRELWLYSFLYYFQWFCWIIQVIPSFLSHTTVLTIYFQTCVWISADVLKYTF